jgi:hypothetical protein
MLLRHSFIVIYVIAFILMVQSLFARTPQLHIYMAQFPLLPLLTPLCLPFVSPSTYLAPSSCDRNHPPPSQVACKLTPFAPLHPVDPPFPNSQRPTCPAPNNDDLGNILALGVQNTKYFQKKVKIITQKMIRNHCNTSNKCIVILSFYHICFTYFCYPFMLTFLCYYFCFHFPPFLFSEN